MSLWSFCSRVICVYTFYSVLQRRSSDCVLPIRSLQRSGPASCLAAVCLCHVPSDRYGLAITAFAARRIDVCHRAGISKGYRFWTVVRFSKKVLERDYWDNSCTSSTLLFKRSRNECKFRLKSVVRRRRRKGLEKMAIALHCNLKQLAGSVREPWTVRSVYRLQRRRDEEKKVSAAISSWVAVVKLRVIAFQVVKDDECWRLSVEMSAHWESWRRQTSRSSAVVLVGLQASSEP